MSSIVPPPPEEDLRALARSLQPAPAASGARLERASLEIALGDRRELVIASVREGELRVVASDGSTEGPFIDAALALLAGADPAARGSEFPSAPGTERPPARVSPLADALEELLTAIVRAGIEAAPSSAAVRSAAEQVLREAPRPTPPGLARALARLRHGINDADVDTVARMLDGGARLARDLREESPSPEAARRLGAWTARSAPRSDVASLSERELVEVGREWLPAASVGSLQRRYLMCTTTGEVFREERLRGEEASVGPATRTLRVGLAHIDEGPAPRRIRLLQYEIAPELSERAHERLVEMAEREVPTILEHYRRSIRQYPALAEPVIVVRAEGHLRQSEEGFEVRDDDGYAIGLQTAPGAEGALHGAEATRRATWLAGRVSETEGRIVIEPLTLGLRGETQSRVLRL